MLQALTQGDFMQVFQRLCEDVQAGRCPVHPVKLDDGWCGSCGVRWAIDPRTGILTRQWPPDT